MNRYIRLLCLIIALLAASCSSPSPAPGPTPAASQKQPGFSTPEEAIQAYCRLDAEGRRLPRCSSAEERESFNKIISWQGAPTEDAVVLISGYRITAVKRKPEGIAEAAVTYSVRGKYAPGAITFASSAESIVFKIRETNDGWKVQSPVVRPHVYPAAMIQGLGRLVKSESNPGERKKQRKDLRVLKNMKRFRIG